MTDRPNLAAFALCAAVAISTGLGLVLYLLTGAVSWSQLGSLCLLAVFVLAWVPAWGLRAQFDHWDRGEQARIAAQQLANAERARAAQQAEPPEPEPDFTAAWQDAARRFAQAGEWHGFDWRTLTANDSPHKIVTFAGWQQLRAALVAGGWLWGENFTRWAPGRSYADWQAERGWEGLIYPPAPPPDVSIPALGGQHPTQPTPQRILEGVGRPVGEPADAA